mgnify:CR=1 FL=1
MKIVIKEDKTPAQRHTVNAGLGPAVVDKAQHDAALATMEQLTTSGQATKLLQFNGTNFSISTYNYEGADNESA